jgi:UDP-D-galactose:(glucosyl)LPS alpha-1,6-D-galactosyltransferase
VRILIIWFPVGLDIWGGGETVLSTLINCKPRKEENIFLATFTKYIPNIILPIFSGAVCPTVNKELKKSFINRRTNFYYDIKKLIKEHNPEVIVQSGSCFFLPLTKMAIENNTTPLVYWDHGSVGRIYSGSILSSRKERIRRGVSRLLAGHALRFADAHLCISSGIAEITKRAVPNTKTYTIYNPVVMPSSTITFSECEEQQFIYVGRLDDRQKNISFLLTSLARLVNKAWHLTIIGDGPDKVALLRLSEYLGLQRRVSFIGISNRPFAEIRCRPILLLTSRFEGFPMVLVEAIAHGIAVISSECLTGPADIVTNYKNGVLFKEGDMEEFTSIIARILDKEIVFPFEADLHESVGMFNSFAVTKEFFDALSHIVEGGGHEA